MAASPSVAADRNWQQSTHTQTRLWIRDKANGPKFEVEFSVRMPDGRTVEAKAKSEDGEAEVTFPDNFGIFGPVAHGAYKWTAQSDGALVGSDEFSQ
jgi:hypothetical protein